MIVSRLRAPRIERDATVRTVIGRCVPAPARHDVLEKLEALCVTVCTSEQVAWFAAGTYGRRKLSGAVSLWMHSRVSFLRQHTRKLPDRRRICRQLHFGCVADTEVDSDDRYGLPRHGPRDT